MTDLQAFKQDTNARFDAVDARFDRMEKKMDAFDTKFDRVFDELTAIRQDMHSISNIAVHNEMEIDYIQRNINLGTCTKKSFWKDNWLMSNLAMPLAQFATAYVITYSGPDTKKDD